MKAVERSFLFGKDTMYFRQCHGHNVYVKTVFAIIGKTAQFRASASH